MSSSVLLSLSLSLRVFIYMSVFMFILHPSYLVLDRGSLGVVLSDELLSELLCAGHAALCGCGVGQRWF